MRAGTLARLRRQLEDERSGRVVFLSHCLLNQNTRYLGGAFWPGAVRDAVDPFLGAGVGISQMGCPERRAWGGVLKRRILAGYGARGRLVHGLRRVVLPLFVRYTAWRYRHLARDVAVEVEDYLRSGFEVVGIVGVAASPSCGVRTTLDLAGSLDAVSSCPIARLDRDWLNHHAIAGCVRPGQGLFIHALERELRRRGLAGPLLEHDLG